jgi:hypothetical protein
MKEEIEQLLEDYKRRLHTVNQMIADTVFFVTPHRLQTKASCYRTIITELERILKE